MLSHTELTFCKSKKEINNGHHTHHTSLQEMQDREAAD